MHIPTTRKLNGEQARTKKEKAAPGNVENYMQKFINPKFEMSLPIKHITPPEVKAVIRNLYDITG